ncbi:MAG TPA: NUDIX domain-containing protein [Sandaracinaceae bacterium]
MRSRRVNAAVVLVVHDGRALVLRRRPDDRSFAHQWCLPGGRIEPGEAPDETAVREIAEETGLTIRVERALGPREIHLRERKLRIAIHRFVARASGSAVRLSDEHVDARWLTRDEAARAEAVLPSGLAGEVTRELLERFARGLEG